MPHSTLAPVFAGLRIGLHALLGALAVFAIVRAFAVSSQNAVLVLVVGLAFTAVYLAGAAMARLRARRAAPHVGDARTQSAFPLIWLAALTALWAVLVWLTPEGAYLVFPLFFLYLHLLPGPAGIAAVTVTTAIAICALGVHIGFSVGGVLGPLVAAGVAVLIGLAYRALQRESADRERLLAELISTREQLAATEREQGALAERARLAREIHDTVAQGLSSIQMLLRAAEPGTDEAAGGYVRLARETAADSLADTRQIIRELTPARLDDGLPEALRRLAAEQQARAGVPIEVRAETSGAELPMSAQTALLRLAQGALANAVRHAAATRIAVDLRTDADETTLAVTDDGRGFDTETADVAAHQAGSFGLRAMRERVDQLGGVLEVDTAPGRGTTVTARLPLAQDEGDAA